jgi:hypothetical protein
MSAPIVEPLADIIARLERSMGERFTPQAAIDEHKRQSASLAEYVDRVCRDADEFQERMLQARIASGPRRLF